MKIAAPRQPLLEVPPIERNRFRQRFEQMILGLGNGPSDRVGPNAVRCADVVNNSRPITFVRERAQGPGLVGEYLHVAIIMACVFSMRRENGSGSGQKIFSARVNSYARFQPSPALPDR